MSGKTAKFLRKSVKVLGVEDEETSRRLYKKLKRDWNRMSDNQRTQMKHLVDRAAAEKAA